jgi:ribosomal protein S18 acetylase RimI-like enzyme
MIRIAIRNDISRIAEVELFTNRYNFKNILSNDFLYNKISYEYNKDWFAGSFDDMENGCGIEYYVFEDEEIIKGYFSIGFNQNHEEVEILKFTVDVPFQQNGFGTKLMNYCLDLTKDRGKNIIKLGVFEKNVAAIKFYEKHGFKIIDKIFVENYNVNIFECIKKL